MSGERLDLTRPLQTRDGRKVVWVADSGLDVEYPVAAYLDGDSTVECYTRSGINNINKFSLMDLVYAPVKREGWVVSGVNCLCMPGKKFLVTSKESAERLAKSHGGSVIRIEWEE